jgi:circadian clock protein KaiB
MTMTGQQESSAEVFERLLIERDNQPYVLRLYVTGLTPRSTEAVAVLRDICEKLLDGRYDLEVIDLYRSPERARSEEIVAAPTLVKRLPLPARRLIGNLADRERVLNGLDLREP